VRHSGQVVTAFSIPPHPPKAVADAYATFNRLGNEYGALAGEIADAREAAASEARDAVRSVADAAKAGRASKVDPAQVEREGMERVAALEARRDALLVAVDEAGDELCVSIAENRSEWIDNLGRMKQEAATRYDRAIADALAALRDFAPVDRACEWLTDFRHVSTMRGMGQQFSGGKVTVRDERFVRGAGAEPKDPADLLRLAAQATAAPEVPQTRRHTVAA
jgi:hypothetical protein